jgi:hypothetical protein
MGTLYEIQAFLRPQADWRMSYVVDYNVIPFRCRRVYFTRDQIATIKQHGEGFYAVTCDPKSDDAVSIRFAS